MQDSSAASPDGDDGATFDFAVPVVVVAPPAPASRAVAPQARTQAAPRCPAIPATATFAADAAAPADWDFSPELRSHRGAAAQAPPAALAASGGHHSGGSGSTSHAATGIELPHVGASAAQRYIISSGGGGGGGWDDDGAPAAAGSGYSSDHHYHHQSHFPGVHASRFGAPDSDSRALLTPVREETDAATPDTGIDGRSASVRGGFGGSAGGIATAVAVGAASSSASAAGTGGIATAGAPAPPGTGSSASVPPVPLRAVKLASSAINEDGTTDSSVRTPGLIAPTPKPPGGMSSGDGTEWSGSSSGGGGGGGDGGSTRGCLTIHPEKPFRVIWEIIGLLVIVWVTMSLPFKVAFMNDQLDDHDPLFGVQIFVDLFFILDVALNFYTAYYDRNDVLVTDAKRIKLHYLQTWFTVDFIGAIPFDYAILIVTQHYYSLLEATKALRLLKLLRLFRLLKVHNLYRYLGRYEEYFSNSFLKVFKLTVTLLMWLHFDACFFFLVARWHEMETGEWADDSWVVKNHLEMADTYVQYLWSLWHVTSHMLSTAYGPENPTRTGEVCMTMISMLAGAALYASVIGTTSSIIQGLDQSGSEFYRQWDELKVFMRHKEMPGELRDRLRKYFNARWKGRKVFDEERIMTSLPEPYVRDLLAHECHTLLQSITLLAQSGAGFVNALLPHLKSRLIMDGELVIAEGEAPDKWWLIARGVVEISRQSHRFAELDDNHTFGEVALLYGVKSPYGVRTVTPCQLYCVDRTAFEQLLSEYPDVAHKMKGAGYKKCRRWGLQQVLREAAQRGEHTSPFVAGIPWDWDKAEAELQAEAAATGEKIDPTEDLAGFWASANAAAAAANKGSNSSRRDGTPDWYYARFGRPRLGSQDYDGFRGAGAASSSAGSSFRGMFPSDAAAAADWKAKYGSRYADLDPSLDAEYELRDLASKLQRGFKGAGEVFRRLPLDIQTSLNRLQSHDGHGGGAGGGGGLWGASRSRSNSGVDATLPAGDHRRGSSFIAGSGMGGALGRSRRSESMDAGIGDGVNMTAGAGGNAALNERLEAMRRGAQRIGSSMRDGMRTVRDRLSATGHSMQLHLSPSHPGGGPGGGSGPESAPGRSRGGSFSGWEDYPRTGDAHHHHHHSSSDSGVVGGRARFEDNPFETAAAGGRFDSSPHQHLATPPPRGAGSDGHYGQRGSSPEWSPTAAAPSAAPPPPLPSVSVHRDVPWSTGSSTSHAGPLSPIPEAPTPRVDSSQTPVVNE